jgi:hypothetical protein
MKKQTKSNLQNTFFTAIAAIAFLFAASSFAMAQAKYKVGDRVECDYYGSGKYEKGTILPFSKTDEPDAANYFYRVKLDSAPNDEKGIICQLKILRPSSEAPKAGNQAETSAQPTARQETVQTTRTQAREDKDGTLLADRELLECPIEQKPARNGTSPQPELLKKVIRCLWEQPAKKGLDGAVTADIDAFQIGAPRKWRPFLDLGNGNASTIVHPVEVKYTLKTFYRRETQVQQNTDIFDCYVNLMHKWECGVSKRIKRGEIKTIPVSNK